MEDNKSWLVQLATAKPSPALVLGMYIVIVSLAGVVTTLYIQSGNIRKETQIKTQADDKIAKAASDSVLFDIIKQKNTELLTLRNDNQSLQAEKNAWIERFIKTTDATAEKQANEYKERIQKFEAVDAKRTKITAQRETILKRAATNINALEQIKSNEN